MNSNLNYKNVLVGGKAKRAGSFCSGFKAGSVGFSEMRIRLDKDQNCSLKHALALLQKISAAHTVTLQLWGMALVEKNP